MTKNKFITMLSQMMGRKIKVYSRWSATDKAGNIYLSNGQKTAMNTIEDFRGVRNEYGKSAGIHSSEITVINNGAISSWGVATATASLVAPGVNENCWGIGSSGAIYSAGVALGNAGAINAGDKIGIKLDLTAKTLTLYKNGTQIIVMNMPPTGTYYTMAIQKGANATSTINTGQSAMSFAGATEWTL